MPMKRVVTPEQLKEGYLVFQPDKIPNVTRHDFVGARKLPDGTYEVIEPTPKKEPR